MRMPYAIETTHLAVPRFYGYGDTRDDAWADAKWVNASAHLGSPIPLKCLRARRVSDEEASEILEALDATDI
jgi:hypothetical protein